MSIFYGAIKGTAVLVLGIHLVGFGLKVNGGDHPANPAWQLVSTFYAFEMSVLKVLLLVGLVMVCSLLFKG